MAKEKALSTEAEQEQIRASYEYAKQWVAQFEPLPHGEYNSPAIAIHVTPHHMSILVLNGLDVASVERAIKSKTLSHYYKKTRKTCSTKKLCERISRFRVEHLVPVFRR